MKDCKLRTYGIEELSKRIQERLFELGCEWINGDKKVQHTNDKCLYVRNSQMTRGSVESAFYKKEVPELTLQDLLDMQSEKKTRQEKFYLWAYVDKDRDLSTGYYLHTDKAEKLEDGELVIDRELQQAISDGRAWKLNPDNPVILEVEG